MKQHLQHDDRPGFQARSVSSGGPELPDVPLSPVEKKVLECLGGRPEAMTLRQLETAVDCRPDELFSAVDNLVAGRLVFRLNTVIPSYASKYPGVRVYGE